MTYYANDVHPIPPDHGAADCDDQLPLISRVGRGIKGNSAVIKIHDSENGDDTRLEGLTYDEASKTYKTEFISENINGGKLMYQYNLRPYTIPRTFTITFIYRRKDRQEWSWTTPAIPYIWTLDNAGTPEEFPDHVVGSGVATLFIKTMHDDDWNERLNFPEGTTRDDFNSPLPEEAWAATITFGKGGDIEVPDFDDIAKVIGITKEEIYNILEDNSITINGINANDLIDYIDKCDKRDKDDILDHLHEDLGFNNVDHNATGAFGGEDNVKDYIDNLVGNQKQIIINSMKQDFDPLENVIVKNLGQFQNITSESWYNQFNGKDCGTITVKYGYSDTVGVCTIFVSWDGSDDIPLPFGCGISQYVKIGTLPEKIAPKYPVRQLIDVQNGGSQFIWLHVNTNGDLLIVGIYNGILIGTLKSILGAVDINTDIAYTTVQATQEWSPKTLFSYFYLFNEEEQV